MTVRSKKKGGKIMRYNILGVLVFLAGLFFVSVLLAQGDLLLWWAFYDVPTITGLAAVIVAVIVITGGSKTFSSACSALMSEEYNISADDIEKAIRLFKLLRRSTVCAAILYSMASAVLGLQDFSLYTIGPNIATILLSVFYAALINLIFINPSINILENRYKVALNAVSDDKQVVDEQQ